MDINIDNEIIHLIIGKRENDSVYSKIEYKKHNGMNEDLYFTYLFNDEEQYKGYISILIYNYKKTDRYLLEIVDTGYNLSYKRCHLSFEAYPKEMPSEFKAKLRELKINQILE